MSNITINGTPLSQFGAILLNGGYGNLLLPAPVKDYVTNDDPLKNGTQVDTTHIPSIKERDVTLTFLLRGDSVEDFMAKRQAFLAELYKGFVVLNVPDLGQTFHLLFRSCTQYENYRISGCKLAVQFNEPDPTNRA